MVGGGGAAAVVVVDGVDRHRMDTSCEPAALGAGFSVKPALRKAASSGGLCPASCANAEASGSSRNAVAILIKNDILHRKSITVLVAPALGRVRS